jgi:(p)ppGpp synthase/HD superfamily hydrolase
MPLMYEEKEFETFLRALRFAAEKHCNQRRKDSGQSPYINHPIAVVGILWETGGVRDMTILVAALLHDTVEDTEATLEEVRELFGEDVAGLVAEMTDDKSLPKAERKRLQIENAPHKSVNARKIKLADKISNVHDMGHYPPQNWPFERKWEYLSWTERVIDNLRGGSPSLEARYDRELAEARELLKRDAGDTPVPADE